MAVYCSIRLFSIQIFTMAIITPGENATISATTVEGQLWQWIQWVQRAESNPAINTLGENRVTGSKDLDSGIFSGNWSLPCSLVLLPDGTQKITGNEYLTGLTFTPGEPKGTFKSINWGSYGLEVIEYIIALQLLQPSNRTPNITASFNANSRTYSGTFRLPFEINDNLQDVPTEFV